MSLPTDNPQTPEEWDTLWQHFDRMQNRVMTPGSITTREEFFSEPVQDRLDFYHWMEDQCGQYACYI